MCFTSDDSKPSVDDAIPDPCKNCRYTTCFSLHASTPPICSSKLCQDCRDLEILNKQIVDAHNLLVNLSKKRYTLKGRINRRHDTLTSHLPLELVSRIFTLAANEPRYHKVHHPLSWHPVLVIGAVCKRWREISLGTPQLWTQVVINPLEHASSVEIAQEWLSRSSPLPLSLSVDTNEESSELPPDTSNIFQLLRSHANRWKDLTLSLSEDMYRDLLNGLEGRVPMDSLTILVTLNAEVRTGTESITVECRFVPKALALYSTPISLLPICWDRLTHLRAHSIEAGEALYVFGAAPNLQDCSLDIEPQNWVAGRYPIPASPLINGSVTCLDTKMNTRMTVGMTQSGSGNTHLIQHLTLPSLNTFSYALKYVNDRQALDTLIAFLDRSRPPLRTFSFSLHDNLLNIGWNHCLSTTTTLHLNIHWTDDWDGENLRAYFQGLKAGLVPLVLPRLQMLSINAPMLNAQTWDALAEIFPHNHCENDTDNCDTLPVVSRPLETVTLYITASGEDQAIMRKSTFNRLRRIRESGVKLKVLDTKLTDLLDPLLQENRLTFIESDEDYGN